MRFGKPVRALCPDAAFDEAEQAYDRARALRVSAVARGELSPVPLAYALPYRTKSLFQAGLHRTVQLADAAASELEARRFVPIFLLARGCLETGCLLYDILLRVLDVVKSPTPEGLANLGEHLRRVEWGAKGPQWRRELAEPPEDPITAINIVTVVERVSRHHPELAELYEHLSEFAHPNCAGMLGAFCVLDDHLDEYRFVDPWLDPVRTDMLVYAIAGLGSGLTLAAESAARLEVHLDDFIRVTEQDLFQRGLWPAHVHYRWAEAQPIPTEGGPKSSGDA